LYSLCCNYLINKYIYQVKDLEKYLDITIMHKRNIENEMDEVKLRLKKIEDDNNNTNKNMILILEQLKILNNKKISNISRKSRMTIIRRMIKLIKIF